MVNISQNNHPFFEGLVFGFDVGTGSIGYAVRRVSEFLDVGVLICKSESNDLSKRRELRRQRRTLRSRNYRRKWFSDELKKLGVIPLATNTHDPITLRLQALKGEKLNPEELYAALTHLFKRRGYIVVPWANDVETQKNGEKSKKKEEGEIEGYVSELKQEMSREGCEYPCQLLNIRQEKSKKKEGKEPLEKWARNNYWPRELLEKEFRAILEAQKTSYSMLAEKADWLLYGDTKEIKKADQDYHVFFNVTGARNPGVLGLRWPRFDNRSPGLDSFQPVDEQGRPLHVVRKNKEAYKNAQWELAVMHFQVIDISTGAQVKPDIKSQKRLREIWESKKRKSKAPSNSENQKSNKNLEISRSVLDKWIEEFSNQYKLIEGQKPLTPQTGSGRARYSTITLEKIIAGENFASPQPILQRKSETTEEALNRYLSDIKHPLVRHRLLLFQRLLRKLIARFGQPDMIVLEAVRSLALGEDKKRELNKRNEEFRKNREVAYGDLASNGRSTSKKAILRYRLWKEADCRCPFCLKTIEQAELGHGADIEHIVPRSRIDCNEFYNLTVAHIMCNRDLKKERTPFEAFNQSPALWEDIKANAKNIFSRKESARKLEIFLSPNAEDLIEQKADLQHTAYISRVIRHVSLIQLGWLNEEGKDPTAEKQNKALNFQVTNGQLTSRLRKAWGLNQILHPLPPGKTWEELTDEEQKQFSEKNRGDLRHHALDAMVIACTLPWLAHRTHGAKDEFGNHGWWTQDEKQRSKAANPLFPNEGEMHAVVKEEIQEVVVQHHVSRSKHKQAYKTTLYGKKAPDTYVAREIFTTLTPKNLSSIWPKELSAYCEAAWDLYVDESKNIAEELKRNKGCIPENFVKKLCFSHFQKWRAKNEPLFYWPKQIKIPICNVRLISVKDDLAVAPFSPGTHAFVKRDGFKEVQIYLSQDEKSFVPVFIPYWKKDAPIYDRPFKKEIPPIAIIRRGMVVETKKTFSTGHPPGKYRILTTSQGQLRLLPHYVADKEEVISSFGFGKKGLQPYWPDFIRVLGYELPHSSPSQS